MKPIYYALLSCLSLCFSGTAANAQSTCNISQAALDAVFGANTLGQSFTMSCSANIYSISVMNNGSIAGVLLSMNIYAGQSSSGTVLGQATTTSVGTGAITFSFPTPVAVAAGQQYSFIVSAPASISYEFGNGSSYSGGWLFNGIGFIPDYDFRFVINTVLPCTNPTVPTVTSTSTTNCGAVNTTISILTGSLNDATNWQWYSGSCGGTSVGSGTSITVAPGVTTVYYVRGEGGCVTPGSCRTRMINVNTPITRYLDQDNDGWYIDTIFGCTKPNLYWRDGPPSGGFGDCDDANNQIHAPQQYYVDGDTDGFGSTNTAMLCSVTAPVGYSTNNTDCNDADNNIHAPQQYYVDADSDGFGSTTTAMLCSATAPSGYSTNSTDCDDVNINIHVPQQYYVDSDGDGFGSVTTAQLCVSSAPAGYSSNNTDCDDNDADKNASFSFYADADNDGYGAGVPVSICAVNASTPPSGYSLNNTDCNDGNNTIWQSASFYVDADADGYDNGTSVVCYGASIPAGYRVSTNGTDCNDNPGTGGATVHTAQLYYADADGDGYGTSVSALFCASVPPVGYSIYNTDCNDTSINIHPGSAEICNGIDDDCNGLIDDGVQTTPEITITGTADVCSQGQASYTATISNGGTNPSYQWWLDGLPVGTNSPNYSVFLKKKATIKCVLTSNAGCITNPIDTSNSITLVIQKKASKIPGGIMMTPNTAICPGESRVYSVPSSVDATSYVWTAPTEGAITSGQGTTSVNVQFNTNFTTTTAIYVYASNACGISANRSKLIIKGSGPKQPSAIMGNAMGACNASGIPYSVIAVPGLSYNWSFDLPSGTIVTGQGTNSVTADFTTGTDKVFLKVTVQNSCGISDPSTLPVKFAPDKPGAISGPAGVCPMQQQVSYSIPPMSNAVSYTWTGPVMSTLSDGTVTSSGNSLTTTSNTITVNYANKAGSIKVKANNDCSGSATTTYAVAFTCRTGEAMGYIQIFPNPVPHGVGNHVNLMFYSANEQKYQLRIMDATGKMVLSSQETATPGSNQQRVDVSSLAAGVYQLIMQGENINYRDRFVVE